MAFDRKLLRMKRQERGISQAQLAEAVGVTPSAISNYERGTRLPPWPVARSLALYFDLAETAFGCGEDETPPAAPPDTFTPPTTEADVVQAVATLVSSGWFKMEATGTHDQDGQEYCKFTLQSVHPMPRTVDGSISTTLLTVWGLQNSVDNGTLQVSSLNDILVPFVSNALPKLAQNPIATDTADAE